VFIEDTLSFKGVHRVHTMEYVFLFFSFLFLPFFSSSHEQIQLDLRFGLPSRDIPPGTTYQNGAFCRPNGHFHRQKNILGMHSMHPEPDMYSGPLSSEWTFVVTSTW
jgi:hypothetical protein